MHLHIIGEKVFFFLLSTIYIEHIAKWLEVIWTYFIDELDVQTDSTTDDFLKLWLFQRLFEWHFNCIANYNCVTSAVS